MPRKVRNIIYAIITVCIAVCAVWGFTGFPARAALLAPAFGLSAALQVLLAIERLAASDLRERSMPAAIAHILGAVVLVVITAVCFIAYVMH